VTKERSRSRNKSLVINTNSKEEDQKDLMSMTITNQFGVTSTIMKMTVTKEPQKKIIKKPTQKGKIKKKVNNKQPESVNKQIESVNKQSEETQNEKEEKKQIQIQQIEKKLLTLKEKSNLATKPKVEKKKKVKYEIKNINTLTNKE